MFCCFKKKVLAFLLLGVLLSSGSAVCEVQQDRSGYRLGPEDVLEISIHAGGVEQVKTEMVVGSQGFVNVPFIGKVAAKDQTLENLEQRIHAPLEEHYFVNPIVRLQIKEYHSLHFFISGAVKHPGKFELDYTPRVMDLVASAGGVLPERGNLAYVLRGVGAKQMSDSDMEASIAKSEPIRIDLIKLLDEGDMTENIRLKAGDTVYIPLGVKLNQAAFKIYIQGKVNSPGIYDYHPGMSALSACLAAGGFHKFAAPNRAKIIRKSEAGQESIKINLNDVVSGDIPDLPLKPGDLIHIPESWL